MVEAKKDSVDVLDCLMMVQESDFSLDSEEEKEMEWLYVQLAFFSKKDKGP